MKQTLLAIACVFLTFQAFSQDKLSVGLSAGLSKPIGDYASTETDTSSNSMSSGLAKAGLSIDLSGNYKLNETFGITGLFRYQTNGVDEDAFLAAATLGSGGLTYNLTTKPWTIYSIMAGVNASFPLGDKLSLESKVLIGASINKSPTFDISVDFLGFPISTKSEGIAQTDISALIGTGVKYELTDNLGITANVDYWMSSTKVKMKNTDSTGGSETTESKDKLALSTINLSLGIAYKLF